jgi:hypothetical protein
MVEMRLKYLCSLMKETEILKYSSPTVVKRKAKAYLGSKIPVLLSSRSDKKYMIYTPDGKKVHFGAMGYEDYTKHKDKERRKNYLNRSTNIKGAWKKDKYSPNNLSIHLLW